MFEEARALTGAATVRIASSEDDDADGLLARAAVQAGRAAEEGGPDGLTALAVATGPGGATTTALIVRAAAGSVLDPAAGEALARLALITGVGLAGARAVERTSRLIESGLVIGSGLDLDSVLRRLVESARRVVGARYAALGILTESGDGLARFIWSGIDDATAMNIGRLPGGRGLLGRLITDPRPLRVAHIGDHPSSAGFPPGHPPMETFLGVPVSLGGDVYGNLYLTDREAGPFTEADERLATTLAAQAAVAIANSRAATEERRHLEETAALATARERERAAAEGHRHAIRAQEAERLRIARELHDETGQVLTAVALELRALDGHVDDVGLERLASARRTLADATAALHDLAIRLRPSGLREHGLASAVERQADRLRAKSGMAVDVSIEGLPGDLAEETEIAVFRIIQECLTNIQRHADARNAGVLIRRVGARVRIIVEDDGVGFDPEADAGHLGLAGIRERLALIGGQATFESAPGEGTTVVIEFPVQPERAPRTPGPATT